MSEDMTFIQADIWMRAILPLLREGYLFKINPIGDSMFPFLYNNRDEVILQTVVGKKLKKGDIILFRRKNGIYILHRIVKIKKEGFYMAGDNEQHLEGPIKKRDMKGVAVEIIRNGKKISCSNRIYWFLSILWIYLRPFRHTLIHFRRRILDLYIKEKKEKKG